MSDSNAAAAPEVVDASSDRELVEAEVIPAGELSDQEKIKLFSADTKSLSLLELCVKEDAHVWSEKDANRKEYNTYVTIRYDKLLNVMAAFRREQIIDAIVEEAITNGKVEIIEMGKKKHHRKPLVVDEDAVDLDHPHLSASQLTQIIGGYEKPPNPEHKALMGIDDGEDAEVLQTPKAAVVTDLMTTTPTGPSGSSSDGGGTEPLPGPGGSKIDRSIDDTGWSEEDAYDAMCGFPMC